MAAARKRVLLLLLSTFALAYSIKDGTSVSPCDYPGVVAVILPPNNTIICSGFRLGGTLYVPEICGAGINVIIPYDELLIAYGDGTKTVTIPVNHTGAADNGIYKMTIPNSMEADCNGDAVLAGSEAVDENSCQVVGFGSDADEVVIYDGTLKSVSLTKSTSAPCCHVIYESLNFNERIGIMDPSVPLNCVSSLGSVCGLGDLGGPVYCNKASGEKVIVGITGSTPCENNAMFLIHDLTGSNSDFKFGISS